MRLATLAVLALAFPAGFTGAQSAEERATVQVISQFSGKPVPRFESLRYAAANGRQGPSLDHPILWRYERQGLPMLVLKESQDWRFVRDPDGDEVWVHARMLSAQSTALIRTETILRKTPDAEASGIAEVEPGVVAALDHCAEGWCQIKAGDHSGWLRQSNVWGYDLAETGL